jgi:hypothetical protein
MAKIIKYETAEFETKFKHERTHYKCVIRVTIDSKLAHAERTIDLEPAGTYRTLNICGDLYEQKRNGRWSLSRSGQIESELTGDLRSAMSPQMLDLCTLWQEWHLNDMRLGTREQREMLKKCASADYNHRVECLKSNNLYEDRGYAYGNEWLVEPISPQVIGQIKRIVKALGGNFKESKPK